MSEENFSPEQSLQLIRSMISKTRQNMSDKSIYFLVWGWLTFIACTAQFILKNIFHYEQHYLVWLVVIIGVVFSIYQARKTGKMARVRTYVDDSMKNLWTGMGIGYFVLSMILTRLGWESAVFPFFIMLYGLGTFISGTFLKFKPLITGGLVAFALAVGSTFVSYDYQMLFGAAAIFFSYILPAYMLRSKNKMETT